MKNNVLFYLLCQIYSVSVYILLTLESGRVYCPERNTNLVVNIVEELVSMSECELHVGLH